eukprot:Gb_12524 [translate_table: standard]
MTSFRGALDKDGEEKGYVDPEHKSESVALTNDATRLPSTENCWNDLWSKLENRVGFCAVSVGEDICMLIQWAEMDGLGLWIGGALEPEYEFRYHRHELQENQCSSILVKHIRAPVHLVQDMPLRCYCVRTDLDETIHCKFGGPGHSGYASGLVLHFAGFEAHHSYYAFGLLLPSAGFELDHSGFCLCSLGPTCNCFVVYNLVWSIVRTFDQPQKYKPFVQSCTVRGDDVRVGSIRNVNVKSGLPATASTERLEVLDDNEHIFSVKILGGDHRLKVGLGSVSTRSHGGAGIYASLRLDVIVLPLSITSIGGGVEVGLCLSPTLKLICGLGETHWCNTSLKLSQSIIGGGVEVGLSLSLSLSLSASLRLDVFVLPLSLTSIGGGVEVGLCLSPTLNSSVDWVRPTGAIRPYPWPIVVIAINFGWTYVHVALQLNSIAFFVGFPEFILAMLEVENYSSIITVHPELIDGRPGTKVIESYVVDVPEGNTREETRFFVEALVKCNLKSLADVSERLASQHHTELLERS